MRLMFWMCLLLAVPLEAQDCVAPTITEAPAGLYLIPASGSQTLSVSATGTNLIYRWSFIYPMTLVEATEATTATTIVRPPYSRRYTITVSNSCGHASAFTTVCFIPRVWAPTVYRGDDQATLLVMVDLALSYRDWPSLQWYMGKSGDTSHPLPGANGVRITVGVIPAAEYWVRATTNCTTYDSPSVLVEPEFVPALSKVSLMVLALALAGLGLFARVHS